MGREVAGMAVCNSIWFWASYIEDKYLIFQVCCFLCFTYRPSPAGTRWRQIVGFGIPTESLCAPWNEYIFWRLLKHFHSNDSAMMNCCNRILTFTISVLVCTIQRWMHATSVAKAAVHPPNFWLIKEGNDISNTHSKFQDHTSKNFFKISDGRVVTTPFTQWLTAYSSPEKGEWSYFFCKMNAKDGVRIT